jgi:hypothetical protein
MVPLISQKTIVLLMCKSDIKKTGHNLDISVLNYSVAVYSVQQAFMIGNLSLAQPLFEDQFFLQNKLHFEIFSGFTTTNYRKNTLLDSSVNYSNSKDNTTLAFNLEYQE